MGEHTEGAVLSVGRLLADGAAKRKAGERLAQALEDGRAKERADRDRADAHVAQRYAGVVVSR